MKHFKVALITFLLILTLLATTACNAIKPIIDSCADDSSATNNSTQSGSSETVFNTVSPASGISFAEYVSEQDYPVGEDFSDELSTAELVADIYRYAINLLSFDISQRGFEVSEAVATTADGKSYIGLAFFGDTDTYSVDGLSMPTAGFLCLIEDAASDYLTDEDVSNGVVAVVDDETFLVDRFLFLDSYSGVIDGHYFVYRQIAPYAVSIAVEEITQSTEYDYSIDCYDFDNGRTLWLKDIARPSLSASSLYSEDEAYNAIVQSIREMLAIQRENHYNAERSLFVAIDPAILESLARGESLETINDYLVSELNSVELGDNQFLVLSATDGVQVIEVADFDEMVAQRRSNGWMQIVLSSLMLVGSIVIACVSFGSSTPAVITSIACLSGAVASVVALSNLVEGIDNVRLASLADIVTPARNPIRDEFVKEFGENGVKIYNAVGIAAMVIQSLTIPVGAGLRLASSVGAGAFQTTLLVGRALLVALAEEALITAASTFVALKVEQAVLESTGDQIAADWWGLGAGFATGILSGAGLNMLDCKFNFSGMYTKPDVVAQMYQQNRNKAIVKMSASSWSDLSEAAQKRAVNRLAKFIARDMGIDDVPNIKYYNADPDKNGSISYGYYDPNDNSIHINLYSMDDSLELVDTLAHEMTHARQYQWIKNGVDNDITYSFRNYVDPDSDYVAYRNQPCESEAFANGEAWRNKLLDWNKCTRESGDGKMPIAHIIENHTTVKDTKPNQGVFNTNDGKAIQSIVDDAWLRRGAAIDEGTRLTYIIPTENCGKVYNHGVYVGEANAIKIVVQESDFGIVSIYPVIY